MRVAIVGCGPKGLFALERLVAYSSGRPDEQIEIDVYEPHPAPGAGPVYDIDQPAFLRMNFCAGQIDMWWRKDGPKVHCRQEDFQTWSGRHSDDYCPRAEVGRYLANGLGLLLQALPPNVSVNIQDRRVAAIGPTEEGAWSVRVGDWGATSAGDYDEVMITTGHEPLTASGRLTATTEAVPAGAVVVVRGFALTFIDAALALTEGRGGRFVRDRRSALGPGRLAYVAGPDAASRIIPFSRTGRPMLAKPGAERGPALAADDLADGRGRIQALPSPITDLSMEFLPILADLLPVDLRPVAARWLSLATSGQLPDATDPLAELRRSLPDGGPSGSEDSRAWLGEAWRSVYPAIVHKLGGNCIDDGQWPSFRRLGAEMERIAFGPPPVNVEKLVALAEAGVVDPGRAGQRPAPDTDAALDAVLPQPGVASESSVIAKLVAAGHARVPRGRRGVEISESCECIAEGGTPTRGLAAYGRPTEDWVIGNDTLNRSLHPQADAWAARVVRARIAA